MGKIEPWEHHPFIFGTIFILANKLQVLGDRILDGMTMKQWLLTALISQFRDGPPTLGEVSELMGSSHQNVKQIALKLQEKGFLRIEKDGVDSRALRLILTEKSDVYWKVREVEDMTFLRELFADLTEEELNVMVCGMRKLNQKVLEMLAKK